LFTDLLQFKHSTSSIW